MVHRQEILSLDLVEGGDAEIVEFMVPAKARALKRPLKALNFPRAAIVAAVLRGGTTSVPGGEFQFESRLQCFVFQLEEPQWYQVKSFLHQLVV